MLNKRFKLAAVGFKMSPDGLAGGESVQTGTQAPDQSVPAGAGDDLLAGLNLGADELKALKANEALLGVVTSLVDSKRRANEEAKSHREKIESQTKAEAERSRKESYEQGKFKELYEAEKAKYQELESKLKQTAVKAQLDVLSVKEGIKKPEYLKLFDTSALEVGDDGKLVGADKAFSDFKKNNPELFSQPTQPTPSPVKPGIMYQGHDVAKNDIFLKAKQNPTPANLAAVLAANRANN